MNLPGQAAVLASGLLPPRILSYRAQVAGLVAWAPGLVGLVGSSDVNSRCSVLDRRARAIVDKSIYSVRIPA